MLLEVKGLAKRFGGLRAVDACGFGVPDGSITALIGPNGSGKTTLFNLIDGTMSPDAGEVWFDGRRIDRMHPWGRAHAGIGRTFQITRLFRGMSVLENILVGRHCRMRAGVLRAGFFWGLAQREEIHHRAAVERIIDFLEINHIRKTPAGTLPYGLQKRVELGRALAAEPQLLLLDEPMAGMNSEEKEDMARFILDVNDEWGTTMMLIEHDMGVVMDISHRVVVLDHGEKLAEGPPDRVRTDPVVIKAYLGEDADR
jgi:branched-chain amino acid transport system ATP-binding protein